ncbi:MAG: hypothetical protein FJ000_09905, partial [Actinobacteria bacterium]|nr:hypothetical protein [Actinomycetota bacterium]
CRAWDSDQVDVISLCRQIETLPGLDDRILQRRTAQVRRLLQSTVVAVANGSVARRFQGMTIWWPDARSWRRERARYRGTAFATQTRWARFLAAYCAKAPTAPALVNRNAPFGLCWTGTIGGTRLALGYDNDTALAIALRSSDGGRRWRQSSRDSWSYALYAAAAATPRRWIACGGDAYDLKSLILVSTDAGRTWRRRPVASARYLFDVEMVDARRGWIAGSSGTLLHTSTGGREARERTTATHDSTVGTAGERASRPAWRKVRTGTRAWLYDVEFLDARTGWVVGTLPPDGSGVILHTTSAGTDPDGDGPQTAWRRTPSPADGGLFGLAVRPSGRVWAVGGDPAGGGSAIVHAADGIDWQTQHAGTDRCLYSVCFIDDRYGWAVGAGGTIVHTSDGGSSWTRQSSPAGFDLYHVEFTDERHGTAVGDAAVMLLTDDGGATWRTRRIVRR